MLWYYILLFLWTTDIWPATLSLLTPSLILYPNVPFPFTATTGLELAKE